MVVVASADSFATILSKVRGTPPIFLSALSEPPLDAYSLACVGAELDPCGDCVLMLPLQWLWFLQMISSRLCSTTRRCGADPVSADSP